MAESPWDPTSKRRLLTVGIGEPGPGTTHRMTPSHLPPQPVPSQPIPFLTRDTYTQNSATYYRIPFRPLANITNAAGTPVAIGNHAPLEDFPKIPLFTRPVLGISPPSSVPAPTNNPAVHKTTQPPLPDPAPNPLHDLADLALSQHAPPSRPRSPLPTGLHSNSTHHLASYRPPYYNPPMQAPKHPTYFDLCRLRNATGPLPGSDQSEAELLALRRDIMRAKDDITELELKARAIAGENERSEWRVKMVEALARVVRRTIDAVGDVREGETWWVNADRQGELWEEAEVRGVARFPWEIEEEGKNVDIGMVDPETASLSE